LAPPFPTCRLQDRNRWPTERRPSSSFPQSPPSRACDIRETSIASFISSELRWQPTGSVGLSLVSHVDELHAPILSRKRIGRILQLRLAVSDRHQVARLDAVVFRKVAFHGVGAPL